PARIELPESFYESSNDDDAKLLISAQRARQTEAERGFKSRQAQEAESLKRRDDFARRHPQTTIRFRFPDQVQIQATFASGARVAALYDFVAQQLSSPRLLRALFLQPPVQDLEGSRAQSLLAARLTPAAVVHVRLADNAGLKPSTLALLRDSTSALAEPLELPPTDNAQASPPPPPMPSSSPSPSAAASASARSADKPTASKMPKSGSSESARDSDSKKDFKETPLPWDKLLVLLSVRLSEPINATLILPFVYQMVEDFNVAKSPKDISFYASLLFASFSVCQTMTIMYWSRLSDRIGRRPVMLIGLVGYLLSFLMFGVARSFAWALAARCLNGLLAGNVAVIKSALAEISDDTNRARMMALLPLMWNIGTVGGSAIGGIFADPVHQYPGVFGDMEIFRVFPYLLPCLIGCSITLFGLVLGVFKLQETLVREPSGKKPFEQRATPPRATPSSSSSSLATETTQLLADGDAPKQLTVRELLTPTVVRVMATNVVVCLAVAMCDQAYPIFAASDPSDGGLGFASREIGFSLAISGVAVLYLQLIAYPKLERKYGALRCYQIGQKITIPFYLAIPFLSLLATRLEESVDGPIPDVPRSMWASLLSKECL
ncbi:hypothetical protein IWW51_004318, partial [Coemansia sp. RSA 2702]